MKIFVEMEILASENLNHYWEIYQDSGVEGSIEKDRLVYKIDRKKCLYYFMQIPLLENGSEKNDICKGITRASDLMIVWYPLFIENLVEK